MSFNNFNFCKYKDMYNIYNLITKIDKNYELLFDKKNKIFVIVNSAKNNQICYKNTYITPLVIDFLQKTRIENIEKIIKEIDNNNDYLTIKKQQEFKEIVFSKTNEIIKYSKRASFISKKLVNRIIGEK